MMAAQLLQTHIRVHTLTFTLAAALTPGPWTQDWPRSSVLWLPESLHRSAKLLSEGLSTLSSVLYQEPESEIALIELDSDFRWLFYISDGNSLLKRQNFFSSLSFMGLWAFIQREISIQKLELFPPFWDSKTIWTNQIHTSNVILGWKSLKREVQVTLVCSANLVLSSSSNIHVSAFLKPNDETFKSHWPCSSTRLFFLPVCSVQGSGCRNLASEHICRNTENT